MTHRPGPGVNEGLASHSSSGPRVTSRRVAAGLAQAERQRQRLPTMPQACFPSLSRVPVTPEGARQLGAR